MTLRRLVRQWLLPFADPRKLLSFAHLPRFIRDYRQFRRMDSELQVGSIDLFPCLNDRTSATPFDAHYFYQSAWLARLLALSSPADHVDVGSSVQMLAVISAFQPTLFLDYRPLRTELSGLTCVAGTVTALPFADGSLESLSCLHVIEHIGLGRYGDPLDPRGSQRACLELSRVVRVGGRLYVSVPVGRERVCFNAHRVFHPATIIGHFAGLRLAEFSLVDDRGDFHPDISPESANALDYGCGLFEFVRDHASHTT